MKVQGQVTRDVRDYVSASLPKHTQVIERMDDANSRLGLGWLCRERTAGGDIQGRKECCEYLNSLVPAVAERMKGTVSQFDRMTLIKMLLVNHETSFKEAMIWHRTFRAIKALSESDDRVIDEASNRISKLNATSLASRIIIEIALCEAPTEGGGLPGRYDIGQLLADASQMFYLGGYSDAMNAEIMPPNIRISPAGDVLMEHGFTDQIVEPFGRKFQSISLNDAAEKYHENYSEFDVIESESDQSETIQKEAVAFEAAWHNEFGFSIRQTQDFVEAFKKLAVTRGEYPSGEGPVSYRLLLS